MAKEWYISNIQKIKHNNKNIFTYRLTLRLVINILRRWSLFTRNIRHDTGSIHITYKRIWERCIQLTFPIDSTDRIDLYSFHVVRHSYHGLTAEPKRFMKWDNALSRALSWHCWPRITVLLMRILRPEEETIFVRLWKAQVFTDPRYNSIKWLCR